MLGGPFTDKVCPAIVGPTASGKTALVTALASQMPLEVISLDSRQIYHGLRIGTAQPTAEELAICPHHLIDFVSPDEKYDALRFREDFENIYSEISQRGGVPVLAGGAGMYLTALRHGFMEIPGNSEEKLIRVRQEVSVWDKEKLRSELQKADPESFQRIHPNDVYRSQRAMEIFLISGQSMTALTKAQKANPCLGLAFPAFVLKRDVQSLDDRISQRTHLMLKQGWLEETETALNHHSAKGPGLQSIGYREIVEHLRGNLSKEELPSAIILVTRQYAKRQRTWFRNMVDSFVGHPDDPAMLQAITSAMEKGPSP